jgi:hypothetical protein
VLDKSAYTALRARCGAYRLCIIEVEARLGKLRVSSELPTQLALDEVHLKRAREARPDESWIVARPMNRVAGQRPERMP